MSRFNENEIIYGSFAILLPYNTHKNYTKFKKKNTICKISPLNKKELDIIDILTTNDNSSKFLLKIHKIVDEIVTENNENINFLNYCKMLAEDYKFNFNLFPFSRFSYFIMDQAQIDLFDICENIVRGYPNFFCSETHIKTKYFIQDVFEGLKFIHSNFICHFDIKPENIVLHNGKFKFIDFGLSEEFPFTSYITNGPRGTFEYIPFKIWNEEIIKKNYNANELEPLIECNDWFRDTCKIWRHIEYSNNYQLNTDKNYSSIYKTDVFALGKTINRILRALELYDDQDIYCYDYISKLIEGDCEKRLFSFELKVPDVILGGEYSLDSNVNKCFNFSQFFKRISQKLKSFINRN